MSGAGTELRKLHRRKYFQALRMQGVEAHCLRHESDRFKISSGQVPTSLQGIWLRLKLIEAPNFI